MSVRLFRICRTKCAAPLSRGYATELKPNLAYLQVTHPDTAPAPTQSLIQEHSKYLLNTYVRPPILFSHGSSCTLTSTSGKDYLDFTAGIAVTALGHSDQGVNNVMAEQAGKIGHASNVYWNEHAGELAKSLIENTRTHGGLGLGKAEGDDKGGRVFFSNSGTEANEGALKFARAYGKTIAEDKSDIVCFSNAFHGRSLGALSCTPNPKYQAPFAPLIPGVKVGEYNDMSEERLKDLVNEKTCGVIVEPIQGEGGVGEGKKEWFEMLGKRCKEVGAVLIYDEIQCGLFRSGEMWAHSSFPAAAQPDIVTMAKPLANGFPIGAIMVRSKIANAISPGMHGTTFGGQPLACAMGVHVLERLSAPAFLDNLQSTSAYLGKKAEKLPQLFPSLIKEIRGRGLIRGIAFKDESKPGELVKLARERGVLLLTAGKDAVRLVPALVVSKEECDKAMGVIESCLHIIEGDKA
ncbi:acetylornithine transaminase, putative [Cryptococcus deneoformans JEC21]|uniref:acetylornithine transaminase n=1 Tax=Cryptococcus deneoformans (strain JEC21 / ATCC MYA-565) TaxID=214684 RepID=Q5KNM0_CRYD1|nr:acetylornithine transaminase, putative [Cryptococcus neoformans var. neoformans JEC21]AAW41137.1 acetylornithine transaminase, putative [Cryptococcus neoformans var. neoformans JEC21]